MDITVKSKYLKISPRKLRLAVNLVRGKNVIQAKNVLFLSRNKGAKFTENLIDSAIATAKEADAEVDKFVIKSIACGDGPRLKRGKPASKGSMMAIKKRQSHLTVLISDNADSSIKKTDLKKQKLVAKKNVTKKDK